MDSLSRLTCRLEDLRKEISPLMCILHLLWKHFGPPASIFPTDMFISNLWPESPLRAMSHSAPHPWTWEEFSGLQRFYWKGQRGPCGIAEKGYCKNNILTKAWGPACSLLQLQGIRGNLVNWQSSMDSQSREEIRHFSLQNQHVFVYLSTGIKEGV